MRPASSHRTSSSTTLAAWFRLACVVVLVAYAGPAHGAPGTPVFDAAGYAVVRPWAESYRLLTLAIRPSDAGGPAEISTISTKSTLLRVERWAVSAQGVPWLSGFVPTQYRPTAVAWADVNGDGAADLLCGEDAYPGGPALEVLLMGPSGPVAPGQLLVLPFPQRGPVSFITTSDVNGDGYVDVGVVGTSNFIEGRMSWVLGGAMGLTLGPTSQTLYSRPAISRLDPDEQPDIVNWEPASLRLDFAQGNGDGTFAPTQAIAEGSGMPHLADLDADGRNDLIAGRFIYRGDASGIPVKVDSLAANVTARVDLDHDGLGDLVAVEDGRIRVARGLGGFQFAPFSDLRCGSISDQYPVVFRFGLSDVVDVTGDSWSDVVGTSAASLGRVLYVVPGRTGGSFFGPLRLSTGSRPAQVALADLTGSGGHVDLVVLARGAARLEIRAGSGDGAFGSAQHYALPAGGRRFAIADLDADGHLDVAVACDTSNTLSIYRGTGAGLGARTDFLTDSPLSDLQIADVDEDGTLDVLAMTQWGWLRGWKGTGSRTLVSAAWSASNQGDGRLRLADWDSDGHLDLVTKDASYFGIFYLMRGAGNGTFGTCVSSPCGGYPFGWRADIQAQSGTAIDVADLLGDGNLYVVYANSDSLDAHYSFFRAFRGDASGFHSIPTHCDFEGGCDNREGYEVAPQPRQLTIADVTGDGLPDAITLSGASGVLTVIPGLGGGQFGTPIGHVVGTDPSSFALGDVDSDGQPDVVVANSGSDDVLVLRHRVTTLSADPSAPPSRLRVRIASAPTAATVKFAVELHGDGEARFEIFDAQGRRLHLQRLEPMSARERVVSLDARALPRSGVLFARLSQGGVAASAAFVRLR